jgi:hypothetical protein
VKVEAVFKAANAALRHCTSTFAAPTDRLAENRHLATSIPVLFHLRSSSGKAFRCEWECAFRKIPPRLCVAPAMEACLADHIWEIEELLVLLGRAA